MARGATRWLVPAACFAALAVATTSCAHAWRGPVTDHFDGRRFHSIDPVEWTAGESIRRIATRRSGHWPDFIPSAPGAAPPERVSGAVMRATLVNHGTVLLQMDGVNILTDPTWARRSIPWIGTWRRRDPGLRLEDLPPIDAVVVSHDHHDHMDVPTLRRLSAMFQPMILTGLGNAAFLARKGILRARDLDWWQSAEIGPGVTVTAVPARHRSGRGLFDRNRTLWCGFVVSGPSGSAYYAGDTGPGTHFRQIRERFPGLRLALLPIGDSDPAWYLRRKHMGPLDVIPASLELGAATTVPVHFGTFPREDEAQEEPVAQLRAALAAAPEPKPRFAILEDGQSLEVPPFEEGGGGPIQKF